MSLHAISVFGKEGVKMKPWKKLHLKAPLSASKKRKYASDQKYHTHFSP